MKLGIVFPGQGSQSVGMGGALASAHPAAADLFARAERVLGYDLLAVVRDGPEVKLRETIFAQPAIYVTNYALAVSAGDLPVAASAGHSFGEYCSLTLAGALSFEDALQLVNERARAMQFAAEQAPGAMTAVLGLPAETVRCATEGAREAGRVRLANFNAPEQIVISGDAAAVARAAELAMEFGAKRVVSLNVSGAWHSELMEPARARFAPFVERVAIAAPRFTVVSNVDAEPYRDAEHIRTNLVRSLTEEVRWHETARRILEEGVDGIVEFGGSSVLVPLIRRMDGAPKASHAGDDAGIAKLLAGLGSRAPA